MGAKQRSSRKKGEKRSAKSGSNGDEANEGTAAAAAAAAEAATWRRDFILLLILLVLLVARWWSPTPDETPSSSDSAAASAPPGTMGNVSTARVGELRFPVSCRAPSSSSSSSSSSSQECPARAATAFGGAAYGPCDRVVVDDFLSASDVEVLLRIADKGMAKGGAAGREGGPTIMDVNSGWVLPPGAHQPLSIYRDQARSGEPLFSKEEYDLYRAATDRLKRLIEVKFGLQASGAEGGAAPSLFFTAPTFITREVGAAQWEPATMHDEYWHPHVDKNNTAHYDYSGLVYLSTQAAEGTLARRRGSGSGSGSGDDARGGGDSSSGGAGEGGASSGDFEGGTLQFFSPAALDCRAFEAETGPCEVAGPPELEVAPVAGRAIIFGSGADNPHRVTRVTAGTRHVLSFWFTCNPRMEMANFLDGKMHVTFNSDTKKSGR